VGVKTSIAVVTENKIVLGRDHLGAPLVLRGIGNIVFLEGLVIDEDLTIFDF
jgi:hypothetical protein